MFKFLIQFILLSIFLTFSSYSKNYENIIINGNERISNETILVFSEIQDNITLDENSLNEILKKLYKSGFFKDVKVKIEGNNLIIEVLENPIIQTVFIEGIKRKKTEEKKSNSSPTKSTTAKKENNKKQKTVQSKSGENKTAEAKSQSGSVETKEAVSLDAKMAKIDTDIKDIGKNLEIKNVIKNI